MRSNIFLSFVLIGFFPFFSSCGDSSSGEVSYGVADNQEGYSCREYKQKCCQYVEDNLGDLIDNMIELDNRDKNAEMTGKEILAALRGYGYMSNVTEMEENLKNNCPDEYEAYQNESGLLLVGELFRRMSLESEDRSESLEPAYADTPK